MSYCTKCGTKLKEGAFFCTRCGQRISGAIEKDVPETPRPLRPETQSSCDYVVKERDDKEFFLKCALVVTACLFVFTLVTLLLLKTDVIGKHSDNTPEQTIRTDVTAATAVMSDVAEDTKEETGPSAVKQDNAMMSASSSPEASVADETDQPPEEALLYDNDNIHKYEFYVADITWEEAFQKCVGRDGNLLRINSEEELDEIKYRLEDSGFKGIVYLGGMRDIDSQEYHWVDYQKRPFQTVINSEDFSKYWLEGEPSFHDGDIQEQYLSMIYVSDKGWVWNDIPNDVFTLYPGQFDGRVAYFYEYDEKDL